MAAIVAEAIAEEALAVAEAIAVAVLPAAEAVVAVAPPAAKYRLHEYANHLKKLSDIGQTAFFIP